MVLGKLAWIVVLVLWNFGGVRWRWAGREAIDRGPGFLDQIAATFGCELNSDYWLIFMKTVVIQRTVYVRLKCVNYIWEDTRARLGATRLAVMSSGLIILPNIYFI